ncbi:WD40 repeat domain-containing protein [Dapis sp. BLCC M229]|uniref:WD40 repeat domain-containing protein n=1 Tax=Dapis sp. BLCC M229 TaxID=3400188 RepID=UPI003CEDEEE8
MLWNENGKLLRTLRGHRGWIESVSFSPDGQLLASGGTEKTIKLWYPETGELLQTLDNDASVKNLNFSSDAQLLVSASGKAIGLSVKYNLALILLKKLLLRLKESHPENPDIACFHSVSVPITLYHVPPEGELRIVDNQL